MYVCMYIGRYLTSFSLLVSIFCFCFFFVILFLYLIFSSSFIIHCWYCITTFHRQRLFWFLTTGGGGSGGYGGGVGGGGTKKEDFFQWLCCSCRCIFIYVCTSVLARTSKGPQGYWKRLLFLWVCVCVGTVVVVVEVRFFLKVVS